MHALNTRSPVPTARFMCPNTAGICHRLTNFDHNPIALHVDVVGRVDVVATAMFCFCIVHSVRLWWHVYREASVGPNLLKCGRSELVSLETGLSNLVWDSMAWFHLFFCFIGKVDQIFFAFQTFCGVVLPHLSFLQLPHQTPS